MNYYYPQGGMPTDTQQGEDSTHNHPLLIPTIWRHLRTGQVHQAHRLAKNKLQSLSHNKQKPCKEWLPICQAIIAHDACRHGAKERKENNVERNSTEKRCPWVSTALGIVKARTQGLTKALVPATLLAALLLWVGSPTKSGASSPSPNEDYISFQTQATTDAGILRIAQKTARPIGTGGVGVDIEQNIAWHLLQKRTKAGKTLAVFQASNETSRRLELEVEPLPGCEMPTLKVTLAPHESKTLEVSCPEGITPGLVAWDPKDRRPVSGSELRVLHKIDSPNPKDINPDVQRQGERGKAKLSFQSGDASFEEISAIASALPRIHHPVNEAQAQAWLRKQTLNILRDHFGMGKGKDTAAAAKMLPLTFQQAHAAVQTRFEKELEKLFAPPKATPEQDTLGVA
jgi:hypothetical protein